MEVPASGAAGLTRAQATRPGRRSSPPAASGGCGANPWGSAPPCSPASPSTSAPMCPTSPSSPSWPAWATVQLLMPGLGRYLGRKGVIISVGMVEIAMRSSPPLVPLLFAPPMQLPALMVLVGLGLLCGCTQCRARQHTGPVHEPPDDRQHPRGHGRRIRHRRIHRRLRVRGQAGAVPHRLRRESDLRLVPVYPAESSHLHRRNEADPGDEGDGLAFLVEPFRNGSCLRAVLFFGFWTSD